MPISSIGSYLPTTQEFITHWTSVNTLINPAVLTLPGTYTVALLGTDRTNLEAMILNVETNINALQNAANDRDIKKQAIRIRMTQFRAMVIAQIGTSLYRRSLPTLPSFTQGESRYLQPFNDMQTLWGQINASPPAGFTGPLLIEGSITLANFTTELTALKTAYNTWNSQRVLTSNAFGARDMLLKPIRTRLQQYRSAVVGVLGAGNPLIDSLPAFSPPAGSTPDPVSLSGVWSGGDTTANLNWSASDDSNLDHYSIRYHPGPRYKAAEEQSVDTVDASLTEYATDYGLPVEGSVAWFKVYVVTSTGNEKGSNAIKITRS